MMNHTLNMLKLGMDIKVISQVTGLTGLTQKEIKQLRADKII